MAPLSPALVEMIDAVPGALVVSSSLDLREGRSRIVAAVERLRDAGALAVRIEQSKLGWDVARWLELFSSHAPNAWHRGAVLSLDGEASVQSCGVHAFSLPDVNVSLDVDRSEIRQLISSLNVYQLAEDPVILSGQTFSPEQGKPRMAMVGVVPETFRDVSGGVTVVSTCCALACAFQRPVHALRVTRHRRHPCHGRRHACSSRASRDRSHTAGRS